MGTEPVPHNDPKKTDNSAERHFLDLKLSPAVVEQTKVRQAAIEAIAARVGEFCDQHRLNRAKTIELIQDCFEFSHGSKADELLARSIGYCMKYNIDFRLMTVGFTDFSRHNVNPDLLHPDHLILWGSLERKLSRLAGNLRSLLVPEVLTDTVRLLEGHVPARVFRLYCSNVDAICRQMSGLQRAGDVVSELSSAMLDLLEAPFGAAQFAEIQKLCEYEVAAGRAPELPSLFEAYRSVVEACGRAHAGDRGPTFQRFIGDLTQRFVEQGSSLSGVLLALSSVLEQKPSDEFLESLKSMLIFHLHTGIDAGQVRTVINCVRDLSDTQGIPELMQTYKLALDRGLVKSPFDSLFLLKELAAQSTLHALSFSVNSAEAQGYIERLAHYTGTTPGKFMSARPGIQEYMQEQVKFYSRLRSTYGQDLNRPKPEASNQSVIDMLIAPAQRALLGWRRLADLYLGFGALTFESRRLPSREPPLMARFGSDVGKMYYINANDVNGFPGRGYAIGKIDLNRVFPADIERGKRRGDPFLAYKQAWPTYAEAFDDLARAEFIYTRGMIIISVPDEKRFGLKLRGKNMQFSLVLFNSHHANPTARIAALVPSSAVAAVMKNTLIKFDDFRGFDSARPDLNQVLGDAEHFLHFARSFGPVFNIGHPRTVTTGILHGEHQRWGSYLDNFDQHLENVKKWDYAFRTENHVALAQLGGYSRERELIMHAAELESQRQILLSAHSLRGDAELWNLTHHLLDVFDLMRIVQARWHRGYTLGAPLSPPNLSQPTQSDAEQDPDETVQDFEPLPPPTSLVHDSGDDVYLNRSALRMVNEAYAYNRLRSDPKIAREGFPILAVVDALNYARTPQMTAYIDTYDMVVTIGENKIPLSAHALSMEDAIFLAQHFLPRAADKPGSIGDLRFLNRRYVGIQ